MWTGEHVDVSDGDADDKVESDGVIDVCLMLKKKECRDCHAGHQGHARRGRLEVDRCDREVRGRVMNVMSVALTTEVKKSMQVMPCATSEKDAVRVGVQQVQDHQARRRDVRCGREQGGRTRKKMLMRKTATKPK